MHAVLCVPMCVGFSHDQGKLHPWLLRHFQVQRPRWAEPWECLQAMFHLVCGAPSMAVGSWHQAGRVVPPLCQVRGCTPTFTPEHFSPLRWATVDSGSALGQTDTDRHRRGGQSCGCQLCPVLLCAHFPSGPLVPTGQTEAQSLI